MPVTSPAAARPQSRYQVRFHPGIAADTLDDVAGAAHVVIVVDVLDDGDVARLGLDAHPGVIRADLRTRSQAARAVLDAQTALGERAFVAIVTPARVDGAFAVEDFLAAGAVVDALAALGLDYSSPEAAAACAAFTALRGAVGHLVTASTAGQEWSAAGRADEVVALCAIDSSDTL